MSVKKESSNLQEDKKQISRRNFMKATGVTAGAIGIASVGSATPALAGEKSESAITNFAVKEVDRPPYMDYPFEGADKLERFDQAKEAFASKDIADQYFNGVPSFMAYAINEEKKVNNDIPGFTLLDHSLHLASWVSYKACPELFSWEPLGLSTLPAGMSKWEASPEENNNIIKKAAHGLGVTGPIGIADLKEQWFYSQEGYGAGAPITFSDEQSNPVQTEEGWIIPKRVNKVIVLLFKMDDVMQKYSPSMLSASAAGVGYSVMTEVSCRVAEFIRGLGYTAIPTIDTASLLVPQAIDAGMGELGRHGLLINPELGSNLRITTVITDMPIASDKPIKFGAAEFCRTCMKCADKCPSQSISHDKEPSYDIKCPSNNPGMKKWYVDTWSCMKFWVDSGLEDCSNCLMVCPYTKPQTWIHDVVKAVSSKTTLFNSTFKVLDDTLGYGSTIEENDPSEYWEKNNTQYK